MRKRRFHTLLIIVLPLALIVISSLLFLLRLSRNTLNDLPEMIKTIADERINGTVQIGSIDVYPSKGIVIKDVVITGKVNNSPLIKIPRATLKVNIVELVFQRISPVAAIKMIDIQEPSVSIRRKADKKWDIYDLLKKTTGGQEVKFKERIQVRSAKLTVYDYASSVNGLPEVNRFHDADAIVSFPDSSNLSFTAKGLGDGVKLSNVSCSGKYNLNNKTYTVSIGLKEGAVDYWSKYPYDSKLRIIGGRADGTISLNKYNQGDPLVYQISADVTKTSVMFNGILKPIADIDGKVGLSKDIVSLNVNAKFGSSPLSASGYVINFKKPKLVLNIASDSANFHEIANNVSFRESLKSATLPDHGRINASVTGESSSPGIKFYTEVPSAGISGMKFSSIKIDGIYANRRIYINNSSANCYDGTADFNGEFNFNKNPGVEIRGNIRSVQIGDLPFFKGAKITGSGSGPLEIAWSPGHLRIDYSLDIKAPRYSQYAFSDGHITGVYDNGISRIKSVDTGLYGGDLSASGVVGKGNTLNFSIYGTDINLAAVGKRFSRSQIVGNGQFAGKITGSLASPKFIGFVEGYEIVASDYTIERITADLVVDRNNIQINKLTVFDYPGSITITGTIKQPFRQQPIVDLIVSVDSIDVDRLTQYARIADLSGGLFSADLKVTGPLKKPDAEGRVLLTDMLYHDIPLDVISSGISYKNQIFDIGELKLHSDKAQLTATGSIDQNDSINISINNSNVPLNRLSDYLKPYASVRGSMNLTGQVTGTLKAPIADISINGVEPVINGRKFTSMSGKISIDNSTASVKNFELLETGSIYKLSNLSYDMRNKSITVDAGITDGHGAMLLALLDSSPYVFQQLKPNIRFKEFLGTIPRPFTAKVDASITGTAKVTAQGMQPDLILKSSITDLTYGANSIKDIQVESSWKNDIISLDRLEVIDGDANISAKASLGPKDALALNIDIHNLPTNALKQIAKIPDNFSGKADVTIEASGSKYKPTTKMSLEIVDPVIGGIKFERLRSMFSSKGNEAGLPDAEKSESVGLIDIDEITIVQNDKNIRTSGYIPVDWRNLSLRNDEQIHLETTLDPDSLSFLSAITGLSIGIRQDGKFEGSAKMAGTIREPSFTGNLIWRKGFINAPRVNQPFEIDKADISLAGNKISIDSFEGRSAQGGSFNADGNITLVDMKPVVNAKVKADSLRVSGKNISNIYGEDVDVTINGDLGITGDMLKPSIKGNLAIPTGQLSMPGKGVPQTPPRVLVFNPSFDVGVSLGQDLRFKSSRLRIPLIGSLSLKGPLSRINVDGRINISNGTILFPVRSMKLMNGSTMDVYVRPDQPSVVNLNITGQTKMTAISGLNQRRQYTITMVARGNLDNLNTAFSSSPPGLSNDAIVALLTGQRQLEQLFTNQAGEFGK
ncbi:MAG: translocation/assembly module TamB domain-containing protein, partial [Armatimonadota bacterium]